MIDTGAHCTRGFEGKVVMVTGAGSGTGRAAALGFAERGALVYAVGRSIAPVEETVALIRHEGGQAHAAQADVAHEEQVRARASPARLTGSRLIRLRTSSMSCGPICSASSCA